MPLDDARSLFNQIKILKANKHYRFTDLILCRGVRWAEDRITITEDDRYKNTILRKYLEGDNNILLKKPPRLRELHEIICQHAYEKKYTRPRNNTLTIPLRLGDITDEESRFNESIHLLQNLAQEIELSKCRNPKQIYIVSALHYGANEVNNRYFFSEESYEKNFYLFKMIYNQLSRLGLRSKIVIKSSEDIDEDICFISRSHYLYPSQSKMTELIQNAHNSFLCNATQKPVFAKPKQTQNLKEHKYIDPDPKYSSLKQFKNIHQGERVVLVCNGPSLNKTDFNLIKDERIIGLNKIHLGLERFGFTPDYIVAINKLVIEQSLQDLIKVDCPKFIMEHEGQQLIKDKNIHPIKRIQGPRAGKRDLGTNFSTDLSKGFIGGNTVTYAALQIAFYMGFSKIIIVGMDHNFYYEGGANQENLLLGADRNHFDPSYFGNMLWQNPDLRASEDAYKCAKDTYEENGRQIVDSTIDGKCNIFSKQSLEDAIKAPTPLARNPKDSRQKIRSFFKNLLGQ